MHWRGGARGLLVPSSLLPPPRAPSALQGRGARADDGDNDDEVNDDRHDGGGGNDVHDGDDSHGDDEV